MAKKTSKPEDSTVMVEMPVTTTNETAYRQRVINTRLTQSQADAARALFDGLHTRGERLASGHHVDNVGDAIRWVLEKIASGIQSEA